MLRTQGNKGRTRRRLLREVEGRMEAEGSSSANARELAPGAGLWLEGQGRRSVGLEWTDPSKPFQNVQTSQRPRCREQTYR